MNKKSVPLSQNKYLGFILASVFYLGLGYFLFIAASNMNYVWKWNSIPKYFAYDETISVEAPCDGKLVLENGKYFVIADDKRKENLKITDEYILEYEIGDDIYEGDQVASLTFTKIGPVVLGLFVTLKLVAKQYKIYIAVLFIQ